MDIKKYDVCVQKWIEQVQDHRESDANVSLKCCKDLIEYGQSKKDSVLLGFAYYYAGEIYYMLNDGDQFFDAMSQALPHLNKAREWELIAQCYNYLGITAVNRGNAPIALDYYLNGINHCKKHGLWDREVVMKINIAALDTVYARYEEAECYLQEAIEFLKEHTETKKYYSWLAGAYINMSKCLILQEKYDAVPENYRLVRNNLWEYMDDLDKLAAYMVEALYYHRTGNATKRDEIIEMIMTMTPENMTLLDMFDDFYDFLKILLEADQEEYFWNLIDILEPMVKSFKILNLQTRILSLKMKYYRKHNRNADYLKAAGLFYEVTELMERENLNMIVNQLNVRRNLEIANQERMEMEIQNRMLQEKSEMDPMTGMFNRFRLNEYSEEAFERAYENQTSLAVGIMDIDCFKEFNDNYGHQAGDECIVAVANEIKKVAEAHNGFCARYGGDEFLIIYEGATYEEAFAYQKELKEAISALAIPHEHSKVVPIVSISQGMCCDIPRKGNRMWDFLHNADMMLYKIKKIEKSNYCINRLRMDEAKMKIGTT